MNSGRDMTLRPESSEYPLRNKKSLSYRRILIKLLIVTKIVIVINDIILVIKLVSITKL